MCDFAVESLTAAGVSSAKTERACALRQIMPVIKMQWSVFRKFIIVCRRESLIKIETGLQNPNKEITRP